jgi:hypothetical protein
VSANFKLTHYPKIPQFDKQLTDAKAKALDKDNFSEAWCKAGARLKCEELLKDAEQIEWAEADRREERNSSRIATQGLTNSCAGCLLTVLFLI